MCWVPYKYACEHNPTSGNWANVYVCAGNTPKQQQTHTLTHPLNGTYGVADHNPLQVTFLFHYFFTFMPGTFRLRIVYHMCMCVSMSFSRTFNVTGVQQKHWCESQKILSRNLCTLLMRFDIFISLLSQTFFHPFILQARTLGKRVQCSQRRKSKKMCSYSVACRPLLLYFVICSSSLGLWHLCGAVERVPCYPMFGSSTVAVAISVSSRRRLNCPPEWVERMNGSEWWKAYGTTS